MSAIELESRPEFAGILKPQESYAVSDRRDLGNRINGWFDKLLIQSGFGQSPSVSVLLCLCGAVLVGGLAFVIQEDLLITAIGAAFGAALPILGLVIARRRRQRQILNQMPPMLDELARSAKTGRSLEHCLRQVADDTPSPLGGELQLCTRKIALGMPLETALRELPERTGVVSTNVLVTALSVHRQTGGDLVRVLERLARTVRDRIEFQGRLQAATAASRATAILMIVLPPAILVFFILRDPDYLTNLMNSSWGRMVTGTACLLEVIGMVWVLSVLRNSERG